MTSMSSMTSGPVALRLTAVFVGIVGLAVAVMVSGAETIDALGRFGESVAGLALLACGALVQSGL